MDRSIAKTVAWSCVRPFQLLTLEPMVRGNAQFLLTPPLPQQQQQPFPQFMGLLVMTDS